MKTTESIKDDFERERVKKAGGPAFPTTKPLDGWGDPAQGMTLRDYYAGQVVGAIMAYAMKQTSFTPTISEIAERAFDVADAMIRARG